MKVGGARPPPFTTFTITSKVAVYAPAEWADTLTLFHLYQYKYSVLGTTGAGEEHVAKPLSPTTAPVAAVFRLTIIKDDITPLSCLPFFMQPWALRTQKPEPTVTTEKSNSFSKEKVLL